MELDDLKSLWIQFDNKLSESTRLNKEILKRMLILKSEKRLNWIKIKAGFNLILPIVLILFLIVPRFQYRATIEFYFGLLLFVPFSTLTYYWSVQYFMRIREIDFTKPITLIRKAMNELEKYKIKITKLAYIFMPFGMIGVFLIAEIPILSKHSLLPISLIITIMISSIYITFKYSIIERFKKLNIEINEIEQLEKE